MQPMDPERLLAYDHAVRLFHVAYSGQLQVHMEGKRFRFEFCEKKMHMQYDQAVAEFLHIHTTPRHAGTTTHTNEPPQLSLLSLLNAATLTSMGSRLMRAWVLSPLTVHAQLLGRQRGVGQLVRRADELGQLRTGKEFLMHCPDLEKIGLKLRGIPGRAAQFSSSSILKD
eukprot:gene37009-44908_t